MPPPAEGTLVPGENDETDEDEPIASVKSAKTRLETSEAARQNIEKNDNKSNTPKWVSKTLNTIKKEKQEAAKKTLAKKVSIEETKLVKHLHLRQKATEIKKEKLQYQETRKLIKYSLHLFLGEKGAISTRIILTFNKEDTNCSIYNEFLTAKNIKYYKEPLSDEEKDFRPKKPMIANYHELDPNQKNIFSGYKDEIPIIINCLLYKKNKDDYLFDLFKEWVRDQQILNLNSINIWNQHKQENKTQKDQNKWLRGVEEKREEDKKAEAQARAVERDHQKLAEEFKKRQHKINKNIQTKVRKLSVKEKKKANKEKKKANKDKERVTLKQAIQEEPAEEPLPLPVKEPLPPATELKQQTKNTLLNKSSWI